MDQQDNSAELPDPIRSDRMEQFVELYSQHYARLQYYLMALLPTSHDAVDVLQETSLVLWKKFDTFEPGTNFMAWACKIARLQAMKQYQRDSRSPKLFESTVLDKLAKDAEEAANRPTARLEILENCIGRLSETDRMLIRRRYEHGSTVKRLAVDIGRTANSLSKSLGRIRRALLNCMEQQLPQEWR